MAESSRRVKEGEKWNEQSLLDVISAVKGVKGRGKEMRKRPRMGATRATAKFLFETKKELKEEEREREILCP